MGALFQSDWSCQSQTTANASLVKSRVQGVALAVSDSVSRILVAALAEDEDGKLCV